MSRESDSLRVRLLLQLPSPLPPRYFVVWSLVPIIVTFFMRSFLRSDGPGTFADALSPFLLTLFVAMMFRIPEIIAYETFADFLSALSPVPRRLAEYVRLECTTRRTVTYICLCNGILAALYFVIITVSQMENLYVVCSALAVVGGSIMVFCANQIHLAATRRYIDSLHGLEHLPMD